MTVIARAEKHLDKIEGVREGVKADIEGLFNKLNVKNFVSMPGDTADALIFSIVQLVVKKYIKPIVKESQEYAKNVVDSKKTL